MVLGSTNAVCGKGSVAAELKGIGVSGNVVCVWSEYSGVGECMNVLDGKKGTGVGEFAGKDLCVGEVTFRSV